MLTPLELVAPEAVTAAVAAAPASPACLAEASFFLFLPLLARLFLAPPPPPSLPPPPPPAPPPASSEMVSMMDTVCTCPEFPFILPLFYTGIA